MKIHDDHLYHGAALTQIAEFPTFKAINPFALENGTNSRSAFVINTDTAVYLKYALKPKKPFSEYIFNFSKSHLHELEELEKHYKQRVFIALVCLHIREICVLTLNELREHIARRKAEKGADESQYQILLTTPANSAFRVYMNEPGKKKKALKHLKVARNRFPNAVFENNA